MPTISATVEKTLNPVFISFKKAPENFLHHPATHAKLRMYFILIKYIAIAIKTTPAPLLFTNTSLVPISYNIGLAITYLIR